VVRLPFTKRFAPEVVFVAEYCSRSRFLLCAFTVRSLSCLVCVALPCLGAACTAPASKETGNAVAVKRLRRQYSEIISGIIATGGPHAARTSAVKLMRAVRCAGKTYEPLICGPFWLSQHNG
jgi:hypothetical protein